MVSEDHHFTPGKSQRRCLLQVVERAEHFAGAAPAMCSTEDTIGKVCVSLGSWGQIAYLCMADVIEYIQEMREILHNLQNRIQRAKQNIEGIRQAMQVSELRRARCRLCQG